MSPEEERIRPYIALIERWAEAIAAYNETRREMAEKGGKVMREIRKAFLKSMREFAPLAGIKSGAPYVSKVEAGKWPLTAPQVVSLRRLLKDNGLLVRDIYLENLEGWTVRAKNTFKRNNIKTFGDVVALGEIGLLSLKNCGLTTCKEIKDRLFEMGVLIPREGTIKPENLWKKKP